MHRVLPITLLAAVTLGLPGMALAGGAGPNDLSVRVDPVAGDDARCALVRGNDPSAAVACRTIARVSALENAAPNGPLVLMLLEPGRHDVPVPVQFRGMVAVAGPGAVQAVVNLIGAGSLIFSGGVQAAYLGVTGTAPGTWITTAGPFNWFFGVTIARARANAPTLSMRGNNMHLFNSLVSAPGNENAVVMKGSGSVVGSTISGGRLAVGPNGAGQGAPPPVVNASVLQGGYVSWGGRTAIYNSAITTPAQANTSAVEVREEPGQAPGAENYPYIALSSIWQRSCRPAISLSRPGIAGRQVAVLLAGSLVRVQAPNCLAPISATQPLGAGRGGASASVVNNRFAGVPGPLDAITLGLDGPVLSGNSVGDPGVEGGVNTRDWPGGMMPSVGSPLLNAATDAFSASAVEVAPQSLSSWRYGEAGFRPQGGANLRNPAPDIGAYERPELLGAIPPPPPPGPGGIDIQPGGPDGDLAPVVNGMDGAIPAPGAPTAGVDTGQRLTRPTFGVTARVGLVVRKTAPVAGPVRVRVRTFQPSRVVLVLRRDFRDNDKVKRSRVIGRQVLRFATAGVRWVNVPLNSGARRGLVSIAATARQPGFDPGSDIESLRLVGGAPVTVSAPSTLRAGANRLTVTTRRAGRVVLVARTSAGRVIGKTAFVARSAGRRVVTVTLAPAALVTGTITISARIAGADAITINRPAG